MSVDQPIRRLDPVEAEALSYKLIRFAEEVSEREWTALVQALVVAGIYLPSERHEAIACCSSGYSA